MEKTPNKWESIGFRKRAGILVPLFSLHSENSVGIGEFADLKLLVDWCRKTGNSIIQLLPLNEVGALFCPYDSVSSFALEPAYLSLRLLPGAVKKSLKAQIENVKKAFACGKAHVDYRVKDEKLRLLRDIYFEEGAKDSADFKNFREEHAYWLKDFTLFKVLKKHYQCLPWYEWDHKYQYREPQALEVFLKEHILEINFEMWVQWACFRQLKAVKEYAGENSILIEGDLPILVSRDSADAWAHPEFFKLEFAAGAPADMYCAKGQRWGMPTYNWQKIQEDGYRYLKEKLKYAENFYDILRIDHVVGLFRIWSIPYNEPLDNQGLNGFFDPQDEGRWEAGGRNILSLILENTKMLICAEDLGLIPYCCTKTLAELGIPGNDIQRWIKDWQVRHDFLGPEDYRLLSAAMLSTHDTTNWPAWWENEAGTIDRDLFIRKCVERGIDYHSVKWRLFDFNLSKHNRLRWLKEIISVDLLTEILGRRKEELTDFSDIYLNSYMEKEKLWSRLGLKGPMQEKATKELAAAILKSALEAKSIFSIQLLQDWMSLTDIFKGDPYQYRINMPGVISQNNWSLAIPISLENLLKHQICKEIKEMILVSGRA